jgi:hypothetical protein
MVRIGHFHLETIQTINGGRELCVVFLRNEGADDELDSLVLYYDISEKKFYGACRYPDWTKPMLKTDVSRMLRLPEIQKIINQYKLRR